MLHRSVRNSCKLLLLCESYGGTAIDYGFSTGQCGLDYCIAEADTTIGMTASTAMAPPTCTCIHVVHVHVRLCGQILHPICQSPPMCPACASTTPLEPKCLNNALSVSPSTFEPAVRADNQLLKILSINFELGPEHPEDMHMHMCMCASPHTNDLSGYGAHATACP